MKKTALITRITGQDGASLSRLLLDKGYTVYRYFYSKKSVFNFKMPHFHMYILNA